MHVLPSEGPDGAHCLRAMCPHPCCWETEHRIGRGIHRQLKSLTSDPGRLAGEVSSADGFPTLSVVNVSEWAERRRPPEVKLVSEEDTASALSSGQPQILQGNPKKSHLLREHGRFPDVSSATLKDSSQIKEVKLRIPRNSQLTSSESCSQMIWIPPQHAQKGLAQTGLAQTGLAQTGLAQARTKSPHLAVKEIICHPSTPSNKSCTLNRRRARKEKDVRFTLMMPQQGNKEYLVDLTDKHTDARVQGGESSVRPAQASPQPLSTLRASGALLLRNKPVVFHSTTGRLPRRTIPQNLPVYKYKLDTETRVDDIDWVRLRNRTYLWTNRSLPACCDRGRPAPLRGDASVSCPRHPENIMSKESTYNLSDLSKSGLKLCNIPSLCQNLDQALDTDGLWDLGSRGSIAPPKTPRSSKTQPRRTNISCAFEMKSMYLGVEL